MSSQNKPRIYYLCPDHSKASGGIKQIYRHVDILNKHGFNAYVLHATKNFKCTWFENCTPVVYNPKIFKPILATEKTNVISLLKKRFIWFKEGFLRTCIFAGKKGTSVSTYAQLNKNDYLVVPENCGPHISKVAKGVKKIFFNQNAHYTFRGYKTEMDEHATPYVNSEVIATMVVSSHNLAYLKSIFPQHKVTRVYNSINPNIFCFASNKKKQIAYMPRKLSEEANQIINSLKFKGCIEGFKIIDIQNKSERETAEILKDSLIFLSFSYREGCPLPPMEAMACGCIVVGYDGWGAKEYLKNDFCYPISNGDEITFIDTMANVLGEHAKDPEVILKRGQKASEYILCEYSTKKETESVLKFWEHIFREHNI
jgi:glycosyltransferase involved in cell wall biosynthesis